MSRTLLVLMAAEPEVPPDDKLQNARRILNEAIHRADAEKAGKLAPKPFPGLKVDKFFGTKLPPVCAQLGCYVTDDGKRFYCVNPACQKHKVRDTKHTRRGRAEKPRFAYFRCPRCDSRSIEMHVISNGYSCRACKYTWKR